MEVDVDHGLLMKATGKTPILEDDDDEIEFSGSSRRSSRGIIKVFSFGYSSAWYCIAFQFVWRFVVSVGLALLVFFLFTRPPPPKMSVKVRHTMLTLTSINLSCHAHEHMVNVKTFVI